MVEHFITASSIHSFRETVLFFYSKIKRFGKKFFGCNSCVLWNELSGDIRSIQRQPNFKVAIKKYF